MEQNDEAQKVPQRAPQRRLTRKTADSKDHETKAEAMMAKLLGTGGRETIHASHCLMVSQKAAFCSRCGRLAPENAEKRKLRKPCCGDASASWVGEQITMLKAGNVSGWKAADFKKGMVYPKLRSRGKAQT